MLTHHNRKAEINSVVGASVRAGSAATSKASDPQSEIVIITLVIIPKK